MRNKLRQTIEAFKKEIKLYQRVLKDKRTPMLGKIFLGLAIGYLLLPFDLIPDFIPVLGQLDDLIIVPLLVFFAIKLIPASLVEEYRTKLGK